MNAVTQAKAEPTLEDLARVFGPYVERYIEKSTGASMVRFAVLTKWIAAPITYALILIVGWLVVTGAGPHIVDTLGQYLGYYFGGFGTAALIGRLKS